MSHPSIIVWTTFNEGRRQHDTAEIVALTKELDPRRSTPAEFTIHNCAILSGLLTVGARHACHGYRRRVFVVPTPGVESTDNFGGLESLRREPA
jgi:hypothetical protein